MSKPDDVILEEVGSTEDAIRHCNADEAMKVSACSLDDAKDPPDVKDTTDDELEDILNDDPPDFSKEDATVLDTLLDLTDMRRNSLGSRVSRYSSCWRTAISSCHALQVVVETPDAAKRLKKLCYFLLSASRTSRAGAIHAFAAPG